MSGRGATRFDKRRISGHKSRMPSKSSVRPRPTGRTRSATGTAAKTVKAGGRGSAGAAGKSRAASKTAAASSPRTVRAKSAAAARNKKPPPAVVAAGPPVGRRAIFIDVENTSGEADLLRVLNHLEIDRKAQPTEVIAVGNWRTIGAKIARMLAAAGVHLVHSAPAVGVRDWSDLWIAVSAGRFLGTARPGDRLEVVSDDRAFDAVADAAANCGVDFGRISYRTLQGTVELAPEPPPSRSRRRRASRRRAAERAHTVKTVVTPPAPVTAPAPVPASVPPAPSAAEQDDAAHTASQEQVRVALARLSLGDPERWMGLDALANELRSEGFTRPPGSPRLITRLRRMRDVQVSPNGMVRLAPHATATAGDVAAAPTDELQEGAGREPAAKKSGRPRRPRGGRRRSSAAKAGATAETVPLDSAPAETPYSAVT